MDESAAVLAEFEEGLLWAIISVVVVWSGWVEGGDEEEVNWSFCIWRTVCNIWEKIKTKDTSTNDSLPMKENDLSEQRW